MESRSNEEQYQNPTDDGQHYDPRSYTAFRDFSVKHCVHRHTIRSVRTRTQLLVCAYHTTHYYYYTYTFLLKISENLFALTFHVSGRDLIPTMLTAVEASVCVLVALKDILK